MLDLLTKIKERSQELRLRPTGADGKIIAFINQKGGVGKTTMAFNTARALAEQGKRVLCLDMDPQANLSLLFGVDRPAFSIHHLLLNSVRELKALHTPVLYSEAVVSGKKMDLIPAGQELSGLELSLASVNTTPKQLVLKRFIEKNDLLKLYDAIIIDSPPTLGLLVVNILCAAHGVIVPFRPDEFSRKGLTHLYDVLEDVAEMGLTQVPQILAHVPNLMDPRRKQEGLDLVRITGEAKGPVTGPFLNRAPLVRSQAQRKSVYDYESHEYQELRQQFDHLAGLITQLQPAPLQGV